MRKISLALALIILLLSLVSCGDKKTDENDKKDNSVPETGELITDFDEIINDSEYLLYYNIFYNSTGGDFVNQKQTKTGTFVTVKDAYSDVTRYYVWGYYDNTKCCDWQWELCPDGLKDLPKEGSKVTVEGTFVDNKKALDGYWLKDATVKLEKEYEGKTYDINMCLMSATLERVQLTNMQQFPDKFKDNSVSVYGRVFSLTSIQHPYYDSTWTFDISTEQVVPAIGTPVIAIGTYSDSTLKDCDIRETELF